MNTNEKMGFLFSFTSVVLFVVAAILAARGFLNASVLVGVFGGALGGLALFSFEVDCD